MVRYRDVPLASRSHYIVIYVVSLVCELVIKGMLIKLVLGSYDMIPYLPNFAHDSDYNLTL